MMGANFDKRIKWYEDAPLCEKCGECKTLVGTARIGFFGLVVGHFKQCIYCLPIEQARIALDIRNSLLFKGDL